MTYGYSRPTQKHRGHMPLDRESVSRRTGKRMEESLSRTLLTGASVAVIADHQSIVPKGRQFGRKRTGLGMAGAGSADGSRAVRSGGIDADKAHNRWRTNQKVRRSGRNRNVAEGKESACGDTDSTGADE
jgi:hypothetical protein